MKNADMPATPSIIAPSKNGLDPVISDGENYFATGLTKREAFAIAAMQGMLSNGLLIDTLNDNSYKYIADSAVTQADFLLKELEK